MGSTQGGGSKKRQHVREVGELNTSSEEEELAGALSLVEEVGSIKSVYQPPIQVLMLMELRYAWN